VLALLLAALVAGVQPPAQARKPAPRIPDARVYVFTTPDPGGPSDEQRGREDSVADLRGALHGRRHVKLVDTRDEADVVVEVLGREERDLGEGGYGGKSFTKFRETIVRFRIASGSRASEIKGVGKGSWKSAAKDAAERIQKWIERG
jgi:hypothetical protein